MEEQSCSLGDVPSIPIGSHCILELFGCPSALLDDVEFIQEVVQEAVKRAKATLLKEIFYQFDPFGVTILALLSESHISIHTWPESGYIAIDVFTCGEHTQPEQACLCFIEAFQASNHSLMTIHRGQFALTIQSTIKYLEKDTPSKSSLALQRVSVKASV